MTSLVDKKHEIGSNPPPKAFPKISPSGLMELCSNANIFPVRPSPDCISSRISKTLFLVQIFLTSGSHLLSGIIIPASP